MTWLEHHGRSERLAAMAEAAARDGEIERARKLYQDAAKAEKQALKPDVVTIVQVKTKRRTVKHTQRFNLQRWIHVKLLLKQRSSQAEHVKLCRALLRCNEKPAFFYRVFFASTTNVSSSSKRNDLQKFKRYLRHG